MNLQGSDALLIGCVYRSPNNTEQENGNIMAELIKATQGRYLHILITDDFNFSSIHWNTLSTTQDTKSIASKCLEGMKDCFWYQHACLPIHHRGYQTSHALDLVFANEETIVGVVDFFSLLGKSHHSGLSFVFQSYTVKNGSDVVKQVYGRGNSDQIRNNPRCINWDKELMRKDIDEAVLCIKSMIRDQVSKQISSYKQEEGFRSKPPWINKTVLDSIRIKNKSYKRYLKRKSDKDYTAYTGTRNQAKSEKRRVKRDYEKQLANNSKDNPERFTIMLTQN